MGRSWTGGARRELCSRRACQERLAAATRIETLLRVHRDISFACTVHRVRFAARSCAAAACLSLGDDLYAAWPSCTRRLQNIFPAIAVTSFCLAPAIPCSSRVLHHETH